MVGSLYRWWGVGRYGKKTTTAMIAGNGHYGHFQYLIANHSAQKERERERAGGTGGGERKGEGEGEKRQAERNWDIGGRKTSTYSVDRHEV